MKSCGASKTQNIIFILETWTHFKIHSECLNSFNPNMNIMSSSCFPHSSSLCYYSLLWEDGYAAKVHENKSNVEKWSELDLKQAKCLTKWISDLMKKWNGAHLCFFHGPRPPRAGGRSQVVREIQLTWCKQVANLPLSSNLFGFAVLSLFVSSRNWDKATVGRYKNKEINL